MLDRKIEKTGTGSTLTLYGDVTVQNAAELREALIEQLAGHSDLTIDLSYVTDCDITLFQLICAAHKKSIKDDKNIHIGKCSSSIFETATSSGFLRTSGCVFDAHQGQGQGQGCLWQCKDAGVKHA